MATMDLRPMTLGEVLDRTFTVYKENFWLFAGIIGIPYLVVVAFSWVYGQFLTSATPAPSPGVTMTPAAMGQLLGETLVSGGLLMIVFLLVLAAAQAATVAAVSDLYLGRAAAIGQSYRQVRGRFLTVLLAMILTMVISVFAAAAPMLLGGALLAVFARSPLAILAVLFMFFGTLAVAIGMYCRMALAVPAATLEPVGAGGAISRSFELTKGNALEVFAVLVLMIFLEIVAVVIFQAPFLFAMGSLTKPHALPLWLGILQSLASWVSGVLVAPIGTIAFSLIYYNQRVRKEAFDLEKLMAALEPGQTPSSPSAA